ncbi:MAG: hypothetical protein Q8754_02555 [Sweet potato little leaf phytoplasma]|nr:hypothetical protein [Sweet potato little leaf phytoplasma]
MEQEQEQAEFFMEYIMESKEKKLKLRRMMEKSKKYGQQCCSDL